MGKKDVFISYKTDQYEEARRVRSALEAGGISCWMAPECIPGGSSYAAEIPKAIRGCQVFVLVLSRKTMTSKWVPKELDSAINEGKTIMPFMLEDFALNDEFNFYLSNVQRYLAYENKAAAMAKMIHDIKVVLHMPTVKINGSSPSGAKASGSSQGWFQSAGQVPNSSRPTPAAERPVIPKSRTWAPQQTKAASSAPQQAPGAPYPAAPNKESPQQLGKKALLCGLAALCTLGALIVPEILSINFALKAARHFREKKGRLKIMILAALFLSSMSLAVPLILLSSSLNLDPAIASACVWVVFGLLLVAYRSARRKAITEQQTEPRESWRN